MPPHDAGDETVGHADRRAGGLEAAAHLGGAVSGLVVERERDHGGQEVADGASLPLGAPPGRELEAGHHGGGKRGTGTHFHRRQGKGGQAPISLSGGGFPEG